MRKLTVAGSVILLAALAVSAASSSPTAFPGRNGRIVFASDRPIPGQPGADFRNGEIYSLDLASGRRRDLSRNPDFEGTPALSPDGSRIAFARMSRSGGNALWLMRRDGRAQRRLADVGSIGLPDYGGIVWSPDGGEIAFDAARTSEPVGLWVIRPDGTGLRRLTDFYAGSPRFSPNGREIAFAGSDDGSAAHLGVIGADGTGRRWLTKPGDLTETEPAWSPDGTRIAFVRATSLVSCCLTVNLFVIGADGSGERRLTGYDSSAPILINSPAWSPNGREIVFLRNGSDGDVDLIRTDGTGLRTIARHGLAPASWSPSGNRLAFGQLVHRKSGRLGVALTVEPLRGRIHRIQLGPSRSLQGGVLWAPRGTSLVYASSSNENDLELFSITPQGRGTRQLTRNRVDDFDPAWSPDGQRVAFARGTIDPDTERVRRSSLYLMDANGRHQRRLTRGGIDTGPSWAPSGRRLVFARDGDLELLDLRGGRLKPLGINSDSSPAWSPDGKLIAFASGTQLQTIRPDGKGERTLFDGGDHDVPAEISRPAWSPDGRSIAFHLRYDHGRWSEDSTMIVSRTGGTQRTLDCVPPSLPPFEPEYSEHEVRVAWSPDGQWLAVDDVAACRIDGSAGYWLTPGVEPDWQPRAR